MSASTNLPLHHKVQKFSSGTGSLGWSRKKGRKTVVVVVLCKRFPGAGLHLLLFSVFLNTELSDWRGITQKLPVLVLNGKLN